ncbi:DNA adenine methylase [Brevibacillus laterosporus]|uniref:DNA adenine methylase n=1 Tax=Brevibacillus laterosporus TaxID=1465 RepID=UPI000EB0781F|nr:DNA adenine methylase [Brevibacillus laterosporus]AYK08882.1 DNA adenine methylase [Brevibacillus laterosporus]
MARSTLIWFGGKGKSAPQIIKYMPEHRVYAEPFGGAGNVLLQKYPSTHEIYNDIDGQLVNFLLIAREYPDKLQEACESLPYSRELYEKWLHQDQPEDSFEKAVRFFYLNRCGIVNGNGPGSYKTGWRHSISSGQSPANGYQTACQLFKQYSERMKGVMIENTDYKTIIEKYDTPGTLFYIDPPYIGREKYYAGGFKEEDHRELAYILQNIEGKVIVSYYDDPLLLEIYPNWRRETFKSFKQVVNGSCNNSTEELLLMNFDDGQMNIFDIG